MGVSTSMAAVKMGLGREGTLWHLNLISVRWTVRDNYFDATSPLLSVAYKVSVFIPILLIRKLETKAMIYWSTYCLLSDTINMYFFNPHSKPLSLMLESLCMAESLILM